MDKAIVVGCGRVGSRLARLLEAEGYEVAVIDADPEALNMLVEKGFQGRTIQGVGIDIEVLEEAGIKDAQAFAAATWEDNTNLMAAQMARELYQVPRVVCRIFDPQRSSIYHDLGLITVCSTTVGARRLRNIIISPRILRRYDIGDGRAMALEVKIGAGAVGKSVSQVEIPGVFRISGVIRNASCRIPDAKYKLQDGDQVFGVVDLGAGEEGVGAMEWVLSALGASGETVNFIDGEQKIAKGSKKK